MTLDVEIMMRIAREQHVPATEAAFGAEGVQALRDTLSAVRALYGRVEPERIGGGLVVLHRVGHVSREPFGWGRPPQRHSGIETLAVAYTGPLREGVVAVEVLPNGQLDLYVPDVPVDWPSVSVEAVVYEFARGDERFLIGGEPKAIFNPSAGLHASVFAIPTYRTLDAALRDYSARFVSTSQCLIFAGCWKDGSRLILKNKPESTMRDSLTQYLKTVLRAAEVRPEQNVDETHPVDVKVTWLFTNRLAIIELKWLGDALTKEGNLLPYRDARAKEGATQLAEYLDWNASQAPTHETVGYLVVVDARRKGLQADTTSLPLADALWYADREIEYDPAYHTFRPDFAEPVRMFAQPALTACKPD